MPGNAAEDGTGASGPGTRVGDLGGVPGSWMWHEPALAILVILGMNQRMEDLTVSFHLSITLPFKYIFKKLLLFVQGAHPRVEQSDKRRLVSHP